MHNAFNEPMPTLQELGALCDDRAATGKECAEFQIKCARQQASVRSCRRVPAELLSDIAVVGHYVTPGVVFDYSGSLPVASMMLMTMSYTTATEK